MKNLGFHMNLAPVMETETSDNCDFLDGRSYGDYQKVIDYGRACINAYQNNNISTVIKHFQGIQILIPIQDCQKSHFPKKI